MVLNGRVIKIDFSKLKKSLAETTSYVYELNKIGNNLNQIVHKLNQTDIVEKQDVEFLLFIVFQNTRKLNRTQEILLREIRKLTKEGIICQQLKRSRSKEKKIYDMPLNIL